MAKDKATSRIEPENGLGELPDGDFNFKSLRGTAVLRWEITPGSTAYLVWTQLRSNDGDDGTFRFSQNVRTLLVAKSANIFMLKIAYSFSR